MESSKENPIIYNPYYSSCKDKMISWRKSIGCWSFWKFHIHVFFLSVFFFFLNMLYCEDLDLKDKYGLLQLGLCFFFQDDHLCHLS